MRFFVEGGFPMVFVTVFGAVALLSAIRFALHPAHGRVAPIVAYGLSVALIAIAGFCVDLAFVCRYVARSDDPDATAILIQGLAESLAPPILGFAVLSAVALVTALGLRRLPPD